MDVSRWKDPINPNSGLSKQLERGNLNVGISTGMISKNMTADSATVFLVDDEARVRKGVCRLLRSGGFALVAFASANEFLAQYDPQKPGCLLLDLVMPGMDGIELQKALALKSSVLPIIFLSGRGDIRRAAQAFRYGAIDFLTKPVNEEQLFAAIRIAFERDSIARRQRAELRDILERLATLTNREREVMKHVVTGRLNKQIADGLGINEHTLKTHRARVMTKMKVQSLA